MGFFLKKVVSTFLMPLPACLLLAAVGGVLFRRGRRRLGGYLTLSSLALVWSLGLGPVADLVVRTVETRSPAFPGDSVAFVVVLGGGHTSDPVRPTSSWLSSAALHRLTEGVALARAQPWSRLVLSGWGGGDPLSNAEVYAEVAASLGFPRSRMIVEPRGMDTRNEAEILTPLLQGHPFALVTSALHMDRAVALFRARGLDPIPAPTGHLSREPRSLDLMWIVPDPSNLVRVGAAWHEVLGLAWARLTGGV